MFDKTIFIFASGFLGFLLILAYILPFVLYRKSIKKRLPKAGTFVINTTDPEKDVVRVELDIPIGELANQKEVTFSVQIEGDGV